MTNNKQKGNRWERECAKRLSLIISDGKDKHVLWRTASSGAYSTINNIKQQQGDLYVIDKKYEYFSIYKIECKNIKIKSIFPIPYELIKIIKRYNKQYKKDWLLLLKMSEIKNGKYMLSPQTIFDKNKIICKINIDNNTINIWKF